MIHPSLRKQLVAEDRWSRTYKVDDNFFAYESKFESDGLTISAVEVESEWNSWDSSEKLGFAKAFRQKAEIAGSDEEVLEFLMANGDEHVVSTIASCLTRHRNKKMVLTFLLEKLEGTSEGRGNLIQALYILGDRSAIPHLHKLHDQLAEQMRVAGNRVDRWTVYDFLTCCKALVHLEGAERYQEEIRSFLNDPDERIRNRAEMALAGPDPSELVS